MPTLIECQRRYDNVEPEMKPCFVGPDGTCYEVTERGFSTVSLKSMTIPVHEINITVDDFEANYEKDWC